MCLSCGCGDVDNDHEQYAAITIQDIFDAANAHHIGADDVVNNIENTYGSYCPDFEDTDEDVETY